MFLSGRRWSGAGCVVFLGSGFCGLFDGEDLRGWVVRIGRRCSRFGFTARAQLVAPGGEGDETPFRGQRCDP